jgi:hypothetical protein
MQLSFCILQFNGIYFSLTVFWWNLKNFQCIRWYLQTENLRCFQIGCFLSLFLALLLYSVGLPVVYWIEVQKVDTFVSLLTLKENCSFSWLSVMLMVSLSLTTLLCCYIYSIDNLLRVFWGKHIGLCQMLSMGLWTGLPGDLAGGIRPRAWVFLGCPSAWVCKVWLGIRVLVGQPGTRALSLEMGSTGTDLKPAFLGTDLVLRWALSLTHRVLTGTRAGLVHGFIGIHLVLRPWGWPGPGSRFQ